MDADVTLRTEGRMFQAMAETLSDIVFIASPDGSWEYTNARIYEVTELPVGSALGRGWTKALHPDDLDRVLWELRDALAADTAFESHFRLQTPHGGHRRFVARAHLLRDDSGLITQWVGSATDVHDLLTLEDALDQANRLHYEFLAMLRHDLRNIVAPIMNAVTLLRNPGADTPQKQRAIEILAGQVRELCVKVDHLQEPIVPIS